MSCDVCLDGVLSGAPVCAAPAKAVTASDPRQPAGTAGIHPPGSAFRRFVPMVRPSAGFSAAALTAPLQSHKTL